MCETDRKQKAESAYSLREHDRILNEGAAVS